MPAGRLRNILDDFRATVIVASTPRRSVLALRDVPGQSSPAFTLPVLQCLTQRQLAVGPLHCDGDDFIVAPCPPDELERRRDRCRPHRLTSPLVRESGTREAGGAFRPATWEEALERVASAIKRVQETHGADAAGVFGSGSLTNE